MLLRHRIACLSLALVACSTELGPRPNGNDGGASDAARLDAALGTRDASEEIDGGTLELDAALEVDATIGEDAATPDSGPAPQPDAGPVTPPCPYAGETFRLRHLQASMQRTDPLADRNRSVDPAFDASAHTISWTEIENIEAVRRIDARAGWQTYWASGRPEVVARNAVPISWRTDTFDFVRATTRMASEGMAGVSPSRWVNRVWLRHRATGLVQSRVAHHAVSGVDGDGEPPVDWRRRMHALDIEAFRDVMNVGDVPVVGSGDFNTTRLRSLLGTSFRYDVPASGGSHGSRLIDWIVRRPNPELSFVEARFITLGTSDHRGVRATYDYSPRCP